MLGDGGETPSRYELLSMVKKHTKLLGKTTVEEEDASDVEMDSQFWHDVLDLYYIGGKESRRKQDDDLVFFVRKRSTQGYGFNDSVESAAPYFVRRWAPKLDNIVGESSLEVDWRRSFYLNLIAHTSYTVTVAICSQEVLRNHQAGQDTQLSPIYKVVKTVYASPSRVLTERDHCYCVLLNAHDGAAFPSDKELHDGSSSSNVFQKNDTSSGKEKNSKLTLFSGFVSFQMVREAYDAGKSRFGSLLGHSPGKTDRLYMKGPGGRGEVEVAVSGVEDQSQQDFGPFSPVISKKGFGIGSVFRKAAYVASEAARQAYAAASSSTSSDDETLPLKCCLMSISLPWEYIAYDLLFKGTPPVNM
uniref:Cw7 protein n=1 Tax=Salix viminalis TaxID=40686 RepID=A0A6N2MXE5_SALVM